MMILPPVTPVMPIDPTRVYELVSANTEAVKAVLFLLGFIAFAVVSSVLTVRCLAKAKTGLYSEIGGSIAMAVAVLLFIRYGASLVALQGLLLYDLLLYASVSDIRTRKAEDWAWIAMIPPLQHSAHRRSLYASRSRYRLPSAACHGGLTPAQNTRRG